MALPKKLLLRAKWGGRSGSLETEVDTVWQLMQRLAGYGRFLTVPWFNVDDLKRAKPISTIEALATDMMRVRSSGDGPNYTYKQSVYVNNKAVQPYADISATLSYLEPRGYMTANQVVVGLETDTVDSDLPAETARWLLGLGDRLVRDMVDVCQPDAVSLDSSEIVRIKTDLGLLGALPVIGYVSWVSEAVMDERDVPEAPIREAYKNGTIFGIDPGVRDPVAAATKLAMRVYSSGKLREIPKIQAVAGL